MIKKFYKPISIFVLAFLISLPIILPYFHTGYFPTHDGEWAVVRLGDMFRSLRDFQFPVRYSGNLNFGYGYPLFNFTYPAPYYIGVILYFLGLDFVESLKFLFASSVILSAISMYLLSGEIWRSKTAGLISSIFYVYLPYRIVDLYARGSIGESLSFVLFPFILYSALKILDKDNSKQFVILGSLSYALLILTHNIMAVLFTPILFIFVIAKLILMKEKKYLDIFIFFILSYSMSAFFWLTALLEKHNISLSVTPIADRSIYFVKLAQLIFPRWGYGLPDGPNGFSYQIGPAHLAVFLISVLVLLYSFIKIKKIFVSFQYIFAEILILLTSILVIMMFPITNLIWQMTPFLKEINYPWTLLAPVGFLISLLSGFIMIQKTYLKYFVFGLTFIAIVLTFPYAKPQSYIDNGDQYYLTNEATTTSSDELMPLWVKDKPSKHAEKKAEIISGRGTIGNFFSTSKSLNFDVNLAEDSIIQVNTIFWPGWKSYVDGKEIKISYNNPKGIIAFAAPEGDHKINLVFAETRSRAVANIISLTGLAVILILSFRILILKKQ